MSKASKTKRNVNDEVRFTDKVIKTSLRNAATHHVESFNYAINKLLPKVCENMPGVDITMKECVGRGDTPITKFPF
jgi:hypothetical protein